MKTIKVGALVAAGVLAGGFATSASAADLGGNCCADLEERIAELEATTARKGNRKVSLTVSGWVGQQVTWWDDGGKSNVYVHDLGSTLASHVKFTGQATILPGWTAGYVLHLEAPASDGLNGTSQGIPDGANLVTRSELANTAGPTLGQTNGVSVLQSFWFIKSDQLGKVSVGKQSQASDNTAILVDGSGSLVPANWVPFDFAGFYRRNSATGVLTDRTWLTAGTWGDVNGLPTNSVRYDSPTFGGFSVSASWGEDDFWDIAGRYAGEWNDFKIAAAVAYSETNSTSGDSINVLQGADTGYLQVGVYVEHVPTGLFAYGAFGNLDGVSGNTMNSNQTWYGKGGIRQRWNPLGHTVFYGEYEHIEQDNAYDIHNLNPDGSLGALIFNGTSDANMWGLGAVQEIDAAAMSIWVKYRHVDAGYTASAISPGALSTDSFQYVGMGGLINF